MKNPFRRVIAIAVGLCGLWGCSDRDAANEAGNEAATETPTAVWQQLSLADFQTFQGEADTWSTENGVIICSGLPRGYIYSKEVFDDFIWEAEYMLVAAEGETDPDRLAATNSGFMIHIQEPHKVWPVSLEVQGKFVEMCSIKANGGAAELTIADNADARVSARHAIGEWNHVQITSRDGALEARLNGELICTSEPGELKSGRIGLQSEGFEVHFRNLRIQAVHADE